MSILIKGMSMPKKGHILSVVIQDGKVICANSRKVLSKDVIELPPHGDLIDRRKLPLAFVDVTDLPIDRCLPVYLQEDVDNAPIVVESEE